MITLSEKNYWRDRLDVYERIDLILLLFDILVQLGRESEAACGIVEISDIFAMLERLGDDELKGLKATVRECAEKNDWTALIVHCTYIWITSIPKMPCLTITLGNMGSLFCGGCCLCSQKIQNLRNGLVD